MNAALVATTPSALDASSPARLVERFLSRRKGTTVAAYRADLEDFRRFTKTATVDEASLLLMSQGHGAANSLADAYRADLIGRGLSSASVNRKLSTLRSLTKMGRLSGLIPWKLEVENEKVQAYRDTRGPGRAGYRKVLDVLDARLDERAKRDRAAVRLLYDLALRRGEVTGLDLEHLDLGTGTVSVLGKGKTERELLSVPDETKAALVEWLSVRGTDPGPLFVNFDHAKKGSRLTGRSLARIVRDLGDAAGLKNLHPHAFRHTAITEACKVAQAAGIGLEEVRDFSRHADVKTLMVYRDRERNVQGRLAALVAAGA